MGRSRPDDGQEFRPLTPYEQGVSGPSLKKKRSITVLFENEDYQRLERLCAKENKPMSAVAREWVLDRLKMEER